MKIAMIGHKRIPSREGGVEVVVEELATRMVKKGHDVVCYNRGGKHVAGSKFNKEELKEYKGIKLKKVITIDKKGLAAMTSSFFATIKALFSKAKVIHYHAEGPCAMMWIIKWFSNKKIIATIHGLDWQRAKWGGFATKYIKFGEKMAAKYADEIIVLSENVKKYFKDTYNRDTIFIPNGVNLPEIKDAKVITEKYDLKNDDYILYLGRIVPEKGIHYLIEAFSKIKTDKKLVIAGGASDTDSYYNEIKELAKKDDRIILTGFVQGEELQELFSNAYIYCLPSDLEGMPLSLLEAMSYSNCCLTSNIDECSEVLEDKGVTFEKSNVKDLEKKLNDLIINEEKVKKYKENAQEFILNKYDWDDVTNKTLELYEKNDDSQNQRDFLKTKLVSKKTKKINMILFFVYLSIYILVLTIFGHGNKISNLRYYMLLLNVIVGFFSLISNNRINFKKIKLNNLYNKELLFTLILAFVFLVFSIFEALNSRIMLHYRTFVQILLFLLPALYCFVLINIFSIKDIIKIIKLTTIICIFAYFCEPNHNLIEFLNLENWKKINFFTSISFTESNQFAEPFLYLFLFFYYVRNLKFDKKEKKVLNAFTILTFLFTILSFKRLGVIFAIFIVLFKPIIKKYDKTISFNPALVLSIFFVIITVIYTKIMQGDIFQNIDIYKLTTGRSWILSLWEKKNYISYGYGSSMLLIGRYLELDLIQIYLELNAIALFLFCFNFFSIAKKNIYTILIMIYAFFNMLTASSLPWSLGWIIMLITICCISTNKCNIEIDND